MCLVCVWSHIRNIFVNTSSSSLWSQRQLRLIDQWWLLWILKPVLRHCFSESKNKHREGIEVLEGTNSQTSWHGQLKTCAALLNKLVINISMTNRLDSYQSMKTQCNNYWGNTRQIWQPDNVKVERNMQPFLVCLSLTRCFPSPHWVFFMELDL